MSHTQRDYVGYGHWKTYRVVVTIRAKSPDDAGKLVENLFDNWSFEDKHVNQPKVISSKPQI